MQLSRSILAHEELDQVQLSKSFHMRDFLASDIAEFYGLPNIPENPDIAIRAAARLCQDLLEPLQERYGKLSIRAAYRSRLVHGFREKFHEAHPTEYCCAAEAAQAETLIWDQNGESGAMEAGICIALPQASDRFAPGADWRSLAWWIHDNLEYSSQVYFEAGDTFFLSWSENPARVIESRMEPVGILTRPGMANHGIDHSGWYAGGKLRRLN
ncbi:MAG: hypothetical protein HKP40_03815 [Litoreibacter sp.]|nr:hypothetical protein [Litoreibacter sp.]